MTPREDLGYTKPSRTTKAESKPAMQSYPTVSLEKRQEIHDWAERKAYELAKSLGKHRSDTDYDEMRKFDAFISNETIRFEKEALSKMIQKES